ncbi:MAG: N-acetylmuramoyl-L-alanine amidase, partial [Candidatus Auribacterota bacterium]|nr:N-acetylmuramoyl-L-alanine amidase [Candidatus Auribacterota bacterium]
MIKILYSFAAIFIFISSGCGDKAPPLRSPTVPLIRLPEIKPGKILRLSEDDPVGYRVVREGGTGPGILLSFPPLEYSHFPRESVRLAGRVEEGTEVLINGSPASVYSSGSYAGLIPLSRDTGEIIITARNDSGETVYSLPVTRSESLPEKREFTLFKARRLGRVIKSHTPLQLLPGRVRLITLAEEMVLKIDGRGGGYLRADMGGDLTGWVRAGAVELMDEVPLGPFRVGNVEFDGSRKEVFFALETSVPVRVEYISPAGLDVVFYNTVADMTTINLGDGEVNCRWNQDREGRTVFHLSGLDCYRWSLGWEGEGYRLSREGRPEENEAITVFIDPGHGGDQWGAVSPGGVMEKDANLKLAQLVVALLRNEGIKALLSRSDDSTVGLYERVEMAREAGADIFLSLHYNSVGADRDPLAHSGVAVFYYNLPARELAGDIYRSLRGIGLKGGGVRWKSLAVIRPADMIAVLAEVAFLSNPEDESLVLDPGFRVKTAEA